MDHFNKTSMQVFDGIKTRTSLRKKISLNQRKKVVIATCYHTQPDIRLHNVSESLTFHPPTVQFLSFFSKIKLFRTKLGEKIQENSFFYIITGILSIWHFSGVIMKLSVKWIIYHHIKTLIANIS